MPESQNEIAEKHIGEWKKFREEIQMPLYERVAGGDEKNAKALADIIKIAQEGERKAFLFQDGGKVEDNDLSVSFENGE